MREFAARLPTVLALGLAVAMAVGCYSTALVARAEMERPRPGTGDACLLPGTHTSPALLDSEAMVRGRSTDGGTTSAWFRAGDLRLAPQGLMAGAGFPIRETASVLVTGLDTAAAKRLSDLAPPGGKLEHPLRLSAAYELQASQGAEALQWAFRFVAGERALGNRGGTWHLERRASVADTVLGTGYERSVVLAAEQIAEVARSPDGIIVGPGISWADSDTVEVRYFDPFLSALAVPLFPLAFLLEALDTRQADDSRQRPSGAGDGQAALVVWAPSQPPEGQRLFDGSARRRAIIKAVATTDLAASVRGDWIGGVTAGIRLRNFYEFAAVAREISWSRPADRGGRVTRPAAGAAVGIHIDTDANPRFALTFAGEVVGAGGTNALTDVTFKWGVRLGLGRYLFVTLSPLNVSSLHMSGPGPEGGDRTTTILSSIELGGAL